MTTMQIILLIIYALILIIATALLIRQSAPKGESFMLSIGVAIVMLFGVAVAVEIVRFAIRFFYWAGN